MKALICGISGQDGAYLARHLLGLGYEVVGTSRDAQLNNFEKLHVLGIFDGLSVDSMSLSDFRSVIQTLMKHEPDEVYNLAGQSSVGLSFEQPGRTYDSIMGGTLNLLEAIRLLKRPIRLYNAGSGECFGESAEGGASEADAFRPRSPYAVAKSAAFWQVANYREAYDLFACSGILFNHESPLRPERFVTRKVVRAVARIKEGSGETLELGNLSVARDWGAAEEYVVAMHAMLSRDVAADFVIATGEAHTLEAFVATAFELAGLDWKDHVRVDDSLFRPTDIKYGCGRPDKAASELKWVAKRKMKDVIGLMLAAELEMLEGPE